MGIDFTNIVDDISDAVGSTAHTAAQAVFGDTDTGNRADAQIDRAMADLNRRQDAGRADIAKELGAYDRSSLLPPNVTSMESFESMTHPDIKARVDSLTPADVSLSARSWKAAEQILSPLITDMQSKIGTIMLENWEGAAASAAQNSVGQYSAASQKLGHALSLVGTKLDSASMGLEATQLQVPPPDVVTGGDVARAILNVGVGNVGAASELVGKSEEQRQQAVLVMNTVYTPAVYQTDSGVPALPPPITMTTNGPGDASTTVPGTSNFPGLSPGGSAGHAGGTGIGINADPNAHTTSAAVQPDTLAPAQSAAAQPTGPSNSLSPNGTQGSGGGNSPAGNASDNTRAASWVSPNSTSGSGGRFGSTNTGRGIGGTGGGMSGTGLPGTGLPGTGYGAAALGNAVLQPAGVAGTQGIPSAGGGGMVGRAGAAGGGGMMPGGRGGGQGDQDTEHKTASFLISVDNGDKLIGVLPLVAPPVIGA